MDTGSRYRPPVTLPFTLIGVPIDSAGTAGGTELAPAALRSLGLGEAVARSDRGDLDVRIRATRRDPATGVVGIADVCETTRALRQAVADTLAHGDIPFLVGGCCAMVPGALAGVRDARGAASLVHLDGHLDLYDQVSSPLGEAADMPVTVGIGLGPQTWVDAAGGASVDPSRVWIIGYRDREQSQLDGMLMPEDVEPPINCLSTPEVCQIGPSAAGQLAASALSDPPGTMWVHLDLDIVDPDLFFANDAPVPAGLDWGQLTELLGPLCSSSALAGFSLGCYNPEKDRDADNGRHIVEMFRKVLAS
jgi:arginase